PEHFNISGTVVWPADRLGAAQGGVRGDNKVGILRRAFDENQIESFEGSHNEPDCFSPQKTENGVKLNNLAAGPYAIFRREHQSSMPVLLRQMYGCLRKDWP